MANKLIIIVILIITFNVFASNKLFTPSPNHLTDVSIVTTYDIGDIQLEYSSINGWNVKGGGTISRSTMADLSNLTVPSQVI